jgi:hypothetical protein
MSTFNLGGFVKSLFSTVDKSVAKFFTNSKFRSYTEYMTVNGFKSTVAYKLYSKGKLIEYEVCPSTLPDDTYLVSASAINGTIVQFNMHELTVEDGSICLAEVDLYDKQINKDLLIAMGKTLNLCIEKHNNKDGIYYDGL